jgi:hypothetical protein
LSPRSRTIALPILAVLVVPPAARAMTIQGGVYLGIQTVNDAKIKSAYGNGSLTLPYLQVSIWRKLFLGIGYETGYEKNANLGVHADLATLSLRGIDLILGYEFGSKIIAAFVKAGYGIFEYRQRIRGNPYVAGFPVNHRKSTAVAAAGIKIYPLKYFFLAGEAKYVPLKVRPYDYSVDLGGWRFLGGLGFSFGL